MKRVGILAAMLLFPAGAFAAATPASFTAARTLLATTSVPGNAYAAGATIVLTAPVTGDFSAFGGSVITAARVSGDGTVIAGSASSRAKVGGDFRALAGTVTIEEPIAGDLLAFGLSVRDAGHVSGNVFVVAANAVLSGGAAGPVTVYANNVFLAGDFASDVTIAASGRVALAEGTVIAGKLVYESPEKAVIPASATITGGVEYTNASYLPNIGTSRILTLINVGFFLFVRILGALILAGLLAGLFPRLAEELADRAHANSVRSILLTMAFGFGALIAGPVLIILLALTFVGIGLALLSAILYALLALLALLYAGILLGSMFARRFLRREAVLWHDGIVGMLILSLITLVPVVGPLSVFALMIFSAGTLLSLFFDFAFPNEDRTPEML